MPPKAQKTPTTGGKAPAGKAPAEKKEAGKKTAAPSGDKKKRTKTRKETYSSYIYKGEFSSTAQRGASLGRDLHLLQSRASLTPTPRSIHVFTAEFSDASQSSSRSTPTPVSPTAP